MQKNNLLVKFNTLPNLLALWYVINIEVVPSILVNSSEYFCDKEEIKTETKNGWTETMKRKRRIQDIRLLRTNLVCLHYPSLSEHGCEWPCEGRVSCPGWVLPCTLRCCELLRK